jgi:hypothetical protein
LILNLWTIFFVKFCNLWILFQKNLRFPSQLKSSILVIDIKMSMYQCYSVLMFEQYNVELIHYGVHLMNLKCDIQFYFFQTFLMCQVVLYQYINLNYALCYTPNYNVSSQLQRFNFTNLLILYWICGFKF